MTPERYKYLTANMEAKLTQEEVERGWRFCCEWDGMLIGPGDRELECCTCKGAQTVTAKRDDSNKSPVVSGCFNYFPNALLAIGMVSKFGSDKYKVPLSEKNWLGLEQERIVNSEGRHLLKEAIEGKYDSESGILHKAHKAWNALADLEKELMGGAELKCELAKCEATKDDFPTLIPGAMAKLKGLVVNPDARNNIDYSKTLPPPTMPGRISVCDGCDSNLDDCYPDNAGDCSITSGPFYQDDDEKLFPKRQPKNLRGIKDIELLAELVWRNGVMTAPVRTTRVMDCHSCLVAIGKDHTADITIYDDGMKELHRLIS